MNSEIIQKLIISIVILFITVVSFQIFKFYARKTQKKLKLEITRYFALKRIMIFVFTGSFLALLILVWGINLRNLWISITGVMAMIAVAFVAIWSLIANILAGLIIFFASPFKVNDSIELKPDGVEGRVLAINTFYTLLIDDEGNHINVPNSQFFQKFIVNLQKKSGSRKQVTDKNK